MLVPAEMPAVVVPAYITMPAASAVSTLAALPAPASSTSPFAAVPAPAPAVSTFAATPAPSMSTFAAMFGLGGTHGCDRQRRSGNDEQS